ncbi:MULTISPECIES: phosphate acyltransferase PlsX [Gemmobacter]|jgi:glycerol-3-phosphate acyltransferase PlsX|uniref:Phosphate acyltransferase n=2 Tax=Gemmobacter TaxID=204456 RepID=A0A2T6AXX5_9RHOB|nr:MULTISPECIES: phosphate acyltransferase PlsX [Gemmobacter]OJY32053.1 MAG: phosphate acyltransferase [Rhodobacterales bacterium 65-51]PTX48646.1 phosphate:acyl-[acyl carrier protein] acyltransferase [Gemmobacter caeni]TWI99553.1 phosphate:acyl-[acyl carrier protein] acyltransferase [Gemmobacter caeni]GHC08357.1 phosphate acyltransferase [Gemmobacter nanjingensis]
MTTNGSERPAQAQQRTIISVDAMGGDRGPAAVVAGLVDSARADADLAFLLHGDEAVLRPLVSQHAEIADRCEIRHAPRVVTMEDKPSQVMRHGAGTSMWSTIDSVKDGEAAVAVSCGNTGALMAVSMIRLRKLPGVNRPAIACLWPSRNPGGFNVMLDVGADIKAEAEDLLQYATMGAAYARNGLHLRRPRVGLLNVGTEEHKGRAELKLAHDRMLAAQDAAEFDFVGFVEGGDIPSNRVDVIVTDGFTGNIALKTGEGTAKLSSDFMREAFASGILSKLGALLALGALKRLQKRIDPRRVNGGVFLGLNGTVVKSHGGADATGVSAAIRLAAQLARSGFVDRLAARVASAGRAGQDAAVEGGGQE